MERMGRVGKMRAGSPCSTLISLSLFSVVGKEFSVPWVVLEESALLAVKNLFPASILDL